MERGINIFQFKKQRMFELSKFGSGRPCSLLLSLFLIALLTISINSGNINVLAAGTPENSTEYCSTDGIINIPDPGTVTSTLTIYDTGVITDLNVKLNISHTYISNLTVSLIAPDDTEVRLFRRVGFNGDEFDDTILDNEALTPISSELSPFAGTYKPQGDLSELYGKSLTGTWKLQVTDSTDGDTGTLNSWCLIIEQEQEEELLLEPPVIQCEPCVPGGICDTISWDVISNTEEYSSLSSETIPSNGTRTSNLVINDFGIIDDLNVKVNISHEWNSELDVYLIAPDSTQVELFTDVGSSSDNFYDTILDSEASQSITEGTGPFTGSFRPEGNLDDLTGKDIRGTWQLEITDDGFISSGTLDSWSLIAQLANILYYVEVAIDSTFNNVVANSGWILNQNHTFNNLDPNQVYWYRVKARPQEQWLQTSQFEFETDTLTDTIATEDGDVVLPVSDSTQDNELVYVIENPSFEEPGGWHIRSTDFILGFYTGGYPGDIWVSHGNYVLGTILNDNFTYTEGDFVDTVQTIDWTGVDILIFDYCNALAYHLTAKILIGNDIVWMAPTPSNFLDPYYNISIDVSDINGLKDLILRVEVKETGKYTEGIFWDNLRTYGSTSDEGLSGNIISIPISINDDDTWDIMTFNATTPAGTTITVDVLGQTGSTPISGYRNILSGTDLSGLTEKTIRLRANLSSDDSTVTPMLHDWSICYTNAACESTWSNIVSSDCN